MANHFAIGIDLPFGKRRRNCGACPSTKFRAGCRWFGRHAIPRGPAAPKLHVSCAALAHVSGQLRQQFQRFLCEKSFRGNSNILDPVWQKRYPSTGAPSSFSHRVIPSLGCCNLWSIKGFLVWNQNITRKCAPSRAIYSDTWIWHLRMRVFLNWLTSRGCIA